MKSINQFIVSTIGDSRYNNTKNIAGIDFVVNTSEEDFRFSNREAKVIATPLSYSGPIIEGSTILVHHNVFKYYNDVKGRRKSGKSFLKENIFLIYYDQLFAYKNNEEWYGYDRFCFVEPIPVEDSYIHKPFSKEPLMGKMTILNKSLEKQGVKVGDIVSFKPESEYEFRIDDVLMYRLFDHAVTLVL